MHDIYLLTGGNIGDRLSYLLKAYRLIESLAGPVVNNSSVYETAPWGITNQQSFLNQVVCIHSALKPNDLLQILLSIELTLGRQRAEKMGPRVIDIDILFYGNAILSQPTLTIPHPRITERRFVLTPLSEIAPGFVHPVLQKTVWQLLQLCKDDLAVTVYDPVKPSFL